MDYLISLPSFMFLTNVFTKKLILRFRCHFAVSVWRQILAFLKDLKLKGRQNDECLSMYIINTIPHGKCCVRYLRTRCFCIRNLTRSLRSLVPFLIRLLVVPKRTVRPHFPWSIQYISYHLLEYFLDIVGGISANDNREFYWWRGITLT